MQPSQSACFRAKAKHDDRMPDDTPLQGLEIEILTADDVAQLLGVDRKTIYAAARRNEIPHRRLGRRLLFERGSIVQWLRQGRVVSNSQGDSP